MFLAGDFQIKGLEGVDLEHGDYLAVLMDTDCSHCRDAVFELNWLAEGQGLPGVVGLSSNGEEEIRAFQEELRVNFPIGQISREDFWRLLENGSVPRTFLVRDNVVERVWDVEIPGEDALIRVSPPTGG
ncbi:MAG: hypothetical protein JRJ09_09150 [Deltaproteobacteria bacterium]|nr:hypothetical protein [Deltaproteobacteria bacterium]MBW2112156.1 hypothetical protein [Deltaproteobacteria bacterium]MBW2353064.1 hypothetical protein [Deltaproteobacteria bacterium]